MGTVMLILYIWICRYAQVKAQKQILPCCEGLGCRIADQAATQALFRDLRD